MVRSLKVLTSFIFWSRWLQAPLYLGLIVAQGVYVYQFLLELSHLVGKIGHLTDTINMMSVSVRWPISHLVGKIGHLTDTDIMLIVLGLIDVVMIANLLI